MWKRGWCSFSSKVTRQPFSASRVAMVEPAGPPPTTRTSHSSWPVAAGIGSGITGIFVRIEHQLNVAPKPGCPGVCSSMAMIAFPARPSDKRAGIRAHHPSSTSPRFAIGLRLGQLRRASRSVRQVPQSICSLPGGIFTRNRRQAGFQRIHHADVSSPPPSVAGVRHHDACLLLKPLPPRFSNSSRSSLGRNRKPQMGYRPPESSIPSDRLYQSGYRNFAPTAIPTS